MPVRLMPTMNTGCAISSRSISGWRCRSPESAALLRRLRLKSEATTPSLASSRRDSGACRACTKTLETGAYPIRIGLREGGTHALGVAFGARHQAVVVDPRLRHGVRPLPPMRFDPFVGAPERGQHTGPFDRERTVLAHRAVADRHGGGRLAGAEPIPGELVVQRPGIAHRRARAARLAGLPERIVGSLAQVDAEVGQIQVVMNRIGG